MTTIRKATRDQIAASIARGTTPRVPKSGIGLVLPDGRRRNVLVDQAGNLTPAGTHYYQATGQPVPTKFDFNQTPERAGRSLTIKLLDGSRKAVSRFDALGKEFVPTALGKRFYAQRKDRYTVLFPVSVDLTRKNGSIFTRADDWMPSTAVELGEIEVSSALSDAAQRTEVKRKAEAWMDAQPLIMGHRILLAGYETHRLDPARSLEFNKISFSAQGDATAVMHRPLTNGNPWSFPFAGVCPEAAENTSETCVSHQLSKYIRIKGKAAFDKEQITEELLQASLELYEDTDESDLLKSKGFTGAAIRRVCESHGIPFHVCWGGHHKLDSFTPSTTKFENLCVYIWGDHLYTVSDPATVQAIAKQNPSMPDASDWILASVTKADKKSPGFADWELFGGLAAGHWYTRDMRAARLELHRQYICPQVTKTA